MGTGGPGADPGPGTKGEELRCPWAAPPSLLELQGTRLAQAQWPAGSAEGAYNLCSRGGLAGRRTGRPAHRTNPLQPVPPFPEQLCLSGWRLCNWINCHCDQQRPGRGVMWLQVPERSRAGGVGHSGPSRPEHTQLSGCQRGALRRCPESLRREGGIHEVTVQ